MENFQMQFNSVGEQRNECMAKAEGKASLVSDSAGIFESIQGVNNEMKQTMKEEMKRRGLADRDIRYIFRMDDDRAIIEDNISDR